MDTAALIAAALAEDIGTGDVTTLATIPADLPATASLIAKQEGVICGLAVAGQAFAACDPAIHWAPRGTDGAHITAGTCVGTATGPARSLLTAERSVLNFVQRLSGVATQTARYVAQLAGTKVLLLDTRKTIPGWRTLEKYAVACGGGVNHRSGLYDRYLVKNNHADLAGGLAGALERLIAHRNPQLALEVEVRDHAELAIALRFHPDIILLDNFSLADTRAAVTTIAGRATIESSGGITLATIRAYAETGVDCISVGALTHSAPALDLHLRIVEKPETPPTSRRASRD